MNINFPPFCLVRGVGEVLSVAESVCSPTVFKLRKASGGQYSTVNGGLEWMLSILYGSWLQGV